MTAEQIQMRELLRDPLYRRWFTQPPKKLPGDRWRVYAQVKTDGPWSKKDFSSWREALRFFAEHHREWHDAALTCRNRAFRPPTVSDKLGRRRNYHAPSVTLQHHIWCPYCRRPTRFGYFSRHHNLPNCLPYKLRCIVCGIAEDAVKHYRLRGN
jgi:hypothetical protein